MFQHSVVIYESLLLVGPCAWIKLNIYYTGYNYIFFKKHTLERELCRTFNLETTEAVITFKIGFVRGHTEGSQLTEI